MNHYLSIAIYALPFHLRSVSITQTAANSIDYKSVYRNRVFYL